MRKVLHIGIFLVATGFCRPAVGQLLHSGYFELGGPGLISVNIERRLEHPTKGFGMRLGVGVIPTFSDAATGGILAFPVGLNYLLGRNETSHLELGAGLTYIKAENTPLKGDFDGTFGHFLVGYRYQPQKTNLMFRVFLSPVYSGNSLNPLYGGVSIGFRFNNGIVRGPSQ